MRSTLLLLAFASLPLAAQTPAKGKKPIPEIAPNEVATIGKKVKSVRVEPAKITLRVGEVVSLDKLTVIAIDSLGNVRGRLVGFDFGIPPGGPADAVPRKVTGVRPGTAELTVRYPRSGWMGRTDPRPFATVVVVVTP